MKVYIDSQSLSKNILVVTSNLARGGKQIPRKIRVEPGSLTPLEEEKTSEPNHHFQVPFVDIWGVYTYISLNMDPSTS